MKTSISNAERNERNLTITKTGYGHWKISCDYRGKRISTVTTNSMAVDNFNSEFGEKDGRGFNRRKEGYQDLINEIIRNNE
jgi:hypothetical protein